MRIFLLSLLLLFTLVSGYGDGIIVLDRNNFDDVLSQVKFVMVEFYLPGCTSCQEFGHEYAKAAQRLSIYPQIKFFEIDGNTEDSLVSRYNIQNFPTTKFFVRGSKTPLEYDGAFKADDIVAWVKDKYDKVSMEVKSPTQVQKYVRDNNLVGLFIGSPQSDDFKAYSEAARHFEDVVFINSDNEAVRDTYGVKDGESGFILFTKFDEGKNVYTGSFNSEELANFIKLEKYQAVMPFNQDAVQRIFYEGEEAIFLFKSKDTAKEIEEAFETAARDLKDRFVMTVVNFEDDVQLPVTDLLSLPLNQLLGIDMDVLPAIRLVVPKNKMRRYSLQGPITVEGIKTFIDEFENDKLQILA